MAEKKPPEKKPWEESDERKKLLDEIKDEEQRAAADAWDKEQALKRKLAKAREEYEKPEPPKSGTKRWGE